MNENPDAWPLNWPPGRPRSQLRERARFQTSLGAAIQGLRDEVRLLGGLDLVISTNIELRKDGDLRADRVQPFDKGVAIYFKLKGKPMAFACDRWDRVRDNVHAIHLTVAALRGIERWGSGSMVEQAFTGFAQLPAPEQPFEVLGVKANASAAEIDQAYRKLASAYHPDRCGDDGQMMARINRARDQMLEAHGG